MSTTVPSGYRLRTMTTADIPPVHALETRMFPLDAWPQEFFTAELAEARPVESGGTRHYWVIEHQPPNEHDQKNENTFGTVVAYGGLMCVLPLADVQTIAVDAEHESRGLGTVLLTEMIAEAQRRGARDLLLEVRADNHRAQQLYLRHGFDHIHTRARYYPPGVDALIMRRPLT